MKLPAMIAALVLLPIAAFAQTVTIEVKGMTCAGCASTVKASLSQIPGAKDIAIDVKGQKASVTFDDVNAIPEDEVLKQAVEKAGYTPGAVR